MMKRAVIRPSRLQIRLSFVLSWLILFASPSLVTCRLQRRKNSFERMKKEYRKQQFQCPVPKPSERDASLLLRPIRRHRNMSLQEFRRFSENEIAEPFIIETPDFDSSIWKPESFLQECGHIPIRIDDYMEDCEENDTCHCVKNKVLKDSNKWGNLAHADIKKLKISTLGDMLRLQQTEAGKMLYLHDAPLSHYCPPKIQHLKIPKYFPRNYDILNYVEESVNSTWVDGGYQWPSIFISRKGTGSALHCDSRMTRFYTKMLSGKKLWRLIGPTEYWRADPNPDRSIPETYPHKFHADIVSPSFEEFPELDGALVYEAVLKPGDILFVPSAWGHQIVNVEDAVMTSLNFYDNEAMAPAKKYAKESEDDSVTNDAWKGYFMPLQDPDYETDIPLDEYVKNQHLANAAVPDRLMDWIDFVPDEVKNFAAANGDNALIGAVRYNFYNLAEYIIKSIDDWDINARSKVEGATALDFATQNNYHRLEGLLRKYGAKTTEELWMEKHTPTRTP